MSIHCDSDRDGDGDGDEANTCPDASDGDQADWDKDGSNGHRLLVFSDKRSDAYGLDAALSRIRRWAPRGSLVDADREGGAT